MRSRTDGQVKLYNLTCALGPRHAAVAVGRRHQRADVVEYHANDALRSASSKASCTAARTWMRRCMCSENKPTLAGYPLWRFFGTGVAVSIPKEKWGVITPKDLEEATPKIRKNDIVMINTGSHGTRRHRITTPIRRPLQGGGRMDRRARREARWHRRAGARPSARHVPRPARAGAGAAASRRRIQGRDRAAHHRRFPALGAGPQDHDDATASPASRISGAISTRSRASAAASSHSRGAGRTAKAARFASSPCSIPSRLSASRPDADHDLRAAAQSAVALRREGQGRRDHRCIGRLRARLCDLARRAWREALLASGTEGELDTVAAEVVRSAARLKPSCGGRTRSTTPTRWSRPRSGGSGGSTSSWSPPA